MLYEETGDESYLEEVISFYPQAFDLLAEEHASESVIWDDQSPGPITEVPPILGSTAELAIGTSEPLVQAEFIEQATNSAFGHLSRHEVSDDLVRF